MKIHLLDMGQKRFGDCILITHNNKTILIDGGHPGDTASIRFQLSKVLQQQPPFHIDLLIVTHCHSDHIGCLPDLVSLGNLAPKAALLADEKMGFGLANDDNMDAVAKSDAAKTIFIAAQEEDHAGMPDAEIEQFLFDAARLVDQYTGMIKQLEQNGTKVQRFPGKDWSWVQPFMEEYEEFGLKILGPTAEHLVICAAAIAKSAGADANAVAADAVSMDLVKTYKNIVQRAAADANDPAADRPGTGAAKNNQSVVLSLEADGWKALLAGDMQFAKAEVPQLPALMNQLFKDVMKAGPYDFIKLTHHSSYNGLNEPILTEWLKHTHAFAHTGGVKDPAHPDKNTLAFLKKYHTQLKYTRTDHNGLITVHKKGAAIVMDIEKGRTNDFTVNTASDEETVVTSQPAAPTVPSTTPVRETAPVVMNTFTTTADGVVKVQAEIPHSSTRVTITIDIDPEKKKFEPDASGIAPVIINDANRLSGLLFITCTQQLSGNIGAAETAAIIDTLRSVPGVQVLDIPLFKRAEEASRQSVNVLKTGNFKGVVILGGYDVVPGRCLIAIDENLAARIKAAGKADFDADNFIIWSDEIYGDADGDNFAELPVSRIPDASSAALVRAALNAPAFSGGERFGIRNLRRPFAQHCYDLVPGASLLEISERFNSGASFPASRQSALYYMLHGSEEDGTRFWGEVEAGGFLEALRLENIPHAVPGSIIFTGCCWGALTVNKPAYRFARGEALRPRLVNESIALTYLQSGALAFVGCTGSHYSPVTPPLDNYGKPMHDFFWSAIAAGQPPAAALWQAKLQYLRDMPHGLTDAFGIAAELKILRQYTCLGLGW